MAAQYSTRERHTNCHHSTAGHFYWWDKYINEPMQMGHGSKESSKAMALFKSLLKSIMLRRTKKDRAADLPLPPIHVYQREYTMDKDEQEFYQKLHTEKRIPLDVYDVPNSLKKDYRISFLNLWLKMAADHPYLVIYSRSAELPHKSMEAVSVKVGCGICHVPKWDKVVTSCRHVFCKACMLAYSDSLENMTCPTCSKSGTMAIECSKNSRLLNKIDLTGFKTSTKLEALKEAILEMVETDGTAKGLVFSAFIDFLDLINFSLVTSGIKCVLVDVHTMSWSENEKAIKSFTEDPNCQIMLMRYVTGGVDFNLTVASHVFLMDPSMDPAEEKHAQERIHRKGQFKPVSVVKFITEDTIEKEIATVRKKTELLFEGIVGESPEVMKELTEEDQREFFPRVSQHFLM